MSPRLQLSGCSNLIKDFNFLLCRDDQLIQMASADEPRQRCASIFILPLVKSQPSSPFSPVQSFQSHPPLSALHVPPLLLLHCPCSPPRSSLSSLCSRFLLRPSGELFCLIDSIHQQSLDRRGFCWIPTLNVTAASLFF